MIIREFSRNDAEPLQQIYNHYVRTSTVTFETEELSVSQMFERLNGPVELGYPCVVAEDAGRVVGYCALHPWRPRFDHTAEATLYLAPDCCGAGLGYKMTERIIQLARMTNRLHAIIACINAENKASIKLVEKLGFEKVAHYRQVGRKFGMWLDDVEYELIF